MDIAGTVDDDTFTFTPNVTIGADICHVVTVNGVEYHIDSSITSQINFNGGGGKDLITMTGTDGDDRATLRMANATLVGAGYVVRASEIESVLVRSGGGSDRAYFYDSAGDERYYARADRHDAYMTGGGLYNYAAGFKQNIANANKIGSATW